MKIENEVSALDFDAACSYRLQVYDNEREHDRFRALNVILGGSPDDGDETSGDEDIQVW